MSSRFIPLLFVLGVGGYMFWKYMEKETETKARNVVIEEEVRREFENRKYDAYQNCIIECIERGNDPSFCKALCSHEECVWLVDDGRRCYYCRVGNKWVVGDCEQYYYF